MKFYADPTLTILQGDVRDMLRTLPDESVQCVVTSPPYWGLRDYGVAGQIGLEASPEAWVAVMVDVFREVRRVLRRDGTVWLNVGDAYASGEKGGPWDAGRLQKGTGRALYADQANRHAQPGLKPKDLLMLPARLAQALQRPYYTGTIRDEKDRIWLAAMLEAEGCLFLHKRKVGQDNGGGYKRLHDSYGAGLEIANTSEAIIRRCMAIAGGRGSVSRQDKARRQPLYRWSMRSNECRDVVRELYPHLVSKQHQARLLLGCPSSGPDAEKAHASLMALHNGDSPTVDFPAPASMFEPGWYVRSDVIWSKLNPMPESVTDRPTKAHEYVFLLTRSSRYFYDADAVREASTTTRPELLEFGDRPDVGGTGHMNDRRRAKRPDGWASHEGGHGSFHRDGREAGAPADIRTGRNLRSVWSIATEPYPASHFATFPQKLVEPCVKAGTSERGCCPECGAPWARETKRVSSWEARKAAGATAGNIGVSENYQNAVHGSRVNHDLDPLVVTTTGWRPTCDHYPRTNEWPALPARRPREDIDAYERRIAPQLKLRAELLTSWEPCTTVPCTALDPFGGSGTTALVANRHGRRAILIELNPDYCAQALERCKQAPLVA